MVPRHRKRITLGPYLLLSTLGKGEFAKVKLGIHVESGQKVAIKLIKMDDMDRSRRIRIDREINVLKTVNHPNIVKMYSVIETRKTLGIVLECATGGELFDYINSRRRLRETEARRLFAQLVDGVHHLHQRQIIHRDLKLENLLLDHHHNLLIIDFGFAHVGTQEQQHEMITSDEGQLPCSLLETACGSPCYAAPELVLTEEGYKGTAADIWSCGVILYAMLCGHLPYQDDNLHQLYRTMVSQPPEFPDYMSTSARDLIQKMMMPDPKDRCSMATILTHPWLQQKDASNKSSCSRLENTNTFSCPVLGGTFSYSNANPRPYSLTTSSTSRPRKAQSLQHNNETQARKPLFMTWLLRKRRGAHMADILTKTAGNDDRPRIYRGIVPEVDQHHIIASTSPQNVITELKHVAASLDIDIKEERTFKLKCTQWQSIEQLQPSVLSPFRAFLQRRHQRDHNMQQQHEVRFNIELCQIENLAQLYVLDMRRIHGDPHAYSNICKTLVAKFHANRNDR